MIVPSIDIIGGSAVQLVGGREQALDAGDPIEIAKRFALAGEIAVVDLDAALGRGDSRAIIEQLCRVAPCRVGGGIRDVDTALHWLDAGAQKIVLGTAAEPDLLRKLPRDRVIVALDAEHDEVVVDGWRTKTGRRIEAEMQRLCPYVGGFLVTFVEREGRMQGVDLNRAQQLRDAAGDAALTVAGGIVSIGEIAALDDMSIDAQVGMALYTGRIDLADAIAAPLIAREPDQLWPTIVCDEHDTTLGLVWSNRESLRNAVATRSGVYFSRSRQQLWRKGETSGNTQELLNIAIDCDRDAMRFTVRQRGAGFCHNETPTCWGEDRGLTALQRRLQQRRVESIPGSYTQRLFDDPELLGEKLIEEAAELRNARCRKQIIHEAADVLYFMLTAMARADVSLAEVCAELDRRALRVRRRDDQQAKVVQSSC